MRTIQLRPELEEYFQRLSAQLPAFSLEDQATALAIYRELARGDAVDDQRLAEALDVAVEEARRRRSSPPIRAFTYPDSQGRILGFGGLAAVPMHHELVVDGRTLWTWCAWDSLFIPELLGTAARVVSHDPLSHNPVRLVVSPGGVANVQPPDAVVSFVRPDADVFGDSAENVMTSFCHYVFFFESAKTGEAWVAEHPGTFLCSVKEAAGLARKLNKRNFGEVPAWR